MEGVDYAFSSPDPSKLYAAGKRFAMRYVGPGTSPKHLTVAEADRIKAAGLSLVTLVEGAAGDAAGGFSVGAAHARSALAMLRQRGFPTDRPMYFAIDYDVSSQSWPAAREYLRGAGSIIGAQLVGIYGEYNAMQWAARDRVAAWFFQTYAWSGGSWYPGNHVEQYRNHVNMAGGVVDLCRSMKTDFGQWGQSGHSGSGGAVAPTQEGKDDMAQVFLFDGKYWISRADSTLRELVGPVIPLPAGADPKDPAFRSGEMNVLTSAHKVYAHAPGDVDARGYPAIDVRERGWTEALVTLTFGPMARAVEVDNPLSEAEVDAIAGSVVDKLGQGFTQEVALTITGSGRAVTTAAPAGDK